MPGAAGGWDRRPMSMRESMPPSDEARAAHMEQLRRTGGATAWSGWVTFAALVLVLLGAMHGFQGFLALFDEGYFVAGERPARRW